VALTIHDGGATIIRRTGLQANPAVVATVNPLSLVDGAAEDIEVTVPGAAVGDFALASFSLDTQGIVLSCRVTAANTVKVRLENHTAGTLDLAEGTLRVRLIK
jgi:hypothetical protein